MTFFKDLRLRLRALLFPSRIERELKEELEFHIELETRKNIAAGCNPQDAERKARLEFGGIAQVEEKCRDTRGVELVTTTFRDLRHALRTYRRAPLFTATVVLTIALGLGIDTALFTIFDAYYFQTVNVRDPQSLYECNWIDATGSGHDFTWDEYRQFAGANPAFAEAFGYLHTAVRVNGRNKTATLVTGDYFQMLGVSSAMGRTLLPEDSATPVLVLSYAEWQNHYAGDPGIVGKTVFVKGYPFQVIGVARTGFTGLGSRTAAFWMPISEASRFDAGPDLFGSAQPRNVSIVGRLGRGSNSDQALAGLNVWVRRFEIIGPKERTPVRGLLTSRATFKPWRAANAFLFAPILLAFSLVLIIGCANVANMLVARGISRQREIGIRISLGASRGRLIRQLLTESLLLALPAAGAGFVFSSFLIRLSLRILTSTLPPGVRDFAGRIPALTPNLEVFGFSMAFAMLASLLFGLIPALQLSRGNIAQSAGNHAGLGVSRCRNVLAAGQITICVVLLITAAVLLRGIEHIRGLNAELSNQETIQVTVQEAFRARALDRLLADPEVAAVVSAERSPVERKTNIDVNPAEGGGRAQIASNLVSPGYFAAFDIPILGGRGFTEGEADARLPLAILSQTAARRLFPNQEAIGRSLRVTDNPETGPRLQPFQTVAVIGIVRDEISRWISNGEDKGLVYLPANTRTPGTALFVRPRGDAETARQRIDSEILSIDPNVADELRRLHVREWVAEEAYSFLIAYWASTAIGLLALMLTLSGVYGVLAFSVSQRTHEIGVRMSMGATASGILGLFLKQSARLGLYGIALGCLLALGVSSLLRSVLVVSNPFDIVVYASVGLLVMCACLTAAYIPSRRAAQLDPSVTLRCD